MGNKFYKVEKLKTDINTTCFYKRYKKQTKSKNPLSRKDCHDICKEFYEELIDNIIYKNIPIKFPLGQGVLKLIKYKPKFKEKEDGTIDTYPLPVDYKATKELWKENPEAKKNKKLIFILNKHSDGYRYRWWWDRRGCKLEGITSYSFRLVRKKKREFAKAIKSGDKTIDFYETIPFRYIIKPKNNGLK